MIKYIILLFNLTGLFLYQLFFQANVSINQSVPANADAGSSFVVEVTINKADISGFAKYQADLPKGFTATVVEKQGATVLSSDNAIKFIWASLPSDAAIKISFKVSVDASVTGPQTIAGKFLYVINNERQEADASSSVTINAAAAASTATPPATTAPTTQSTSPAANTAAVTPPAVTAPSSAVSITRAYSATTVAPAGDINVTLTVHKGNLSGFAKLEESIPNGIIAAEGDKQGASFTFVDNKAKFVWLSLPTDSVFTVSYKITASSTASGEQSVSGEFSYLQDNNAQTYKVAPTTFTVQSTPAPVANVTQPATTTTQPAETATQPVAPITQPAATTNQPAETATQPVAPVTQPAAITTQSAETATQPAATTTQPSATETANAVTPNIPAASGSVNYRVQIMALHNAVKAAYLAKKFGITETIKEEMLEGYTKYTVGSFTEYKSVRDHREEIKNKGVPGPFVVAYNGGKRITVQEALMITRQQWYK